MLITTRLLSPRLVARAARFHRDEDGVLIVFGLFLFLLMAMIGGLGLDLMRYEERRTHLQNSLDRCVLMAASLTNDLDAEGVVLDCMDKSGLAGQVQDVEVTEGLNFKDVVATGRVPTNPLFLHMIGIDDLDAMGASGAAQRTSNVEIVLVLDVSGSMQGAKIANLRTAASEFVDTLLADDTDNRFAVTIVPYNAQVNLGETLRARYNATNLHGVRDVNCFDIPSSTYATVGISRTLPLPMTAFADTVSSTTRNTSYIAYNTSTARMDPNQPFCRNTAANIVRLPSNDVVQLQSQINALQAAGNTSITLGMKWGLSLIDPAARPMFNDLVNAGAIPAKFRGRPFDWGDAEAMKVMVLMTDGEHVAHTKTNDAVKTGIAPVWRSRGDGNYSVLHTSRPMPNQYWVPHRSAWQAMPWDSGTGADRISWENLWSVQRQTWVAWQFYARALGTSSTTRDTVYSDTMNMFRSTFESVANMNAQLQTSCGQAKANGVIVYGIAFEAPTNGRTQISQCASSAAHYFDAQGLEIQTAFRTIASNISQLKLTQ